MYRQTAKADIYLYIFILYVRRKFFFGLVVAEMELHKQSWQAARQWIAIFMLTLYWPHLPLRLSCHAGICMLFVRFEMLRCSCIGKKIVRCCTESQNTAEFMWTKKLQSNLESHRRVARPAHIWLLMFMMVLMAIYCNDVANGKIIEAKDNDQTTHSTTATDLAIFECHRRPLQWQQQTIVGPRQQ